MNGALRRRVYVTDEAPPEAEPPRLAFRIYPLFCLWVQHVDCSAARTHAELQGARHRHLAKSCASVP